MLTWIDRLLKDRDELIRRDRVLATQLLGPNEPQEEP